MCFIFLSCCAGQSQLCTRRCWGSSSGSQTSRHALYCFGHTLVPGQLVLGLNSAQRSNSAGGLYDARNGNHSFRMQSTSFVTSLTGNVVLLDHSHLSGWNCIVVSQLYSCDFFSSSEQSASEGRVHAFPSLLTLVAFPLKNPEYREEEEFVSAGLKQRVPFQNIILCFSTSLALENRLGRGNGVYINCSTWVFPLSFAFT